MLIQDQLNGYRFSHYFQSGRGDIVMKSEIRTIDIDYYFEYSCDKIKIISVII
jgi:hypothetical protein